MGNIINGIMRKAVRDVEVRGHLIPKGWRVLVYFRAVHLDAAVHDDPHAFNPWRWKERADVVMSSSGFTPFGGGQRLCPGLDLARLEASIFLHHLVTSFRYKYRCSYSYRCVCLCVNGRPILLAHSRILCTCDVHESSQLILGLLVHACTMHFACMRRSTPS